MILHNGKVYGDVTEWVDLSHDFMILLENSVGYLMVCAGYSVIYCLTLVVGIYDLHKNW